MKKIKKYYPGVNGLVYDNSKSYGVLNPKPEDPNAFSTGKMLFPEQKTLGNIVDRKTFSSETLSKNAPSFMDKAGDFMGSYGNIIGSVGTGIASLINANKKQDPTGKPYKTGTNMIKYQKGTEAAKNIKYIFDKNVENDAVNRILIANAMNAKRNAELNNRVAPKKLEGKKAVVKTDSLKTNKPNLIKYQGGTEDIIGPGPLDNLPEMSPEQLKKFNEYDGKKEIAAAIDRVNRMGAPVSQLAPRMASFKAPKQTPMTPNLNRVPVKEQSRKEKKVENKKLEGMAKAPITYNENSFVGPPQFVGPSNQVPALKMMGPSNEELQLGRTRENANAARNTYETRLAGEEARDQYESDMRLQEKAKLRNEAKAAEAIKSGIPSSLTAPTFNKEAVNRYMEKQACGPVSTEKNPILYKETPNRAGLVSFKDMTPAQQKQYRAGIASGNKFTVEGIGEYGAATKQEKAQSARMAVKGGNKPLVKMKEQSGSKNPYIQNGKVVKDYTTKEGLRVYHNTEGPSRIGDPKTGRMGKYEYNPKTDKFGIIWDKKSAQNSKTMPGYKLSKPIYEFDTVVKDTQQKNKDVQKPTQTRAQADSAINSIKLASFPFDYTPKSKKSNK